MSLINIRDLNKSYGTHHVLKGIDLSVEEGQIVGVLGPSGSGKTTLIEIMVGHLKKDSGISEIFNYSSELLTDDHLSQIGAMMDNLGLFERLSLVQNLEIFRKIYNLPRSRIDNVLREVGLFDCRNNAVHDLSKGMKQRLALARAYMHKPKILILDEPTSGLDPQTALEVYGILKSIAQQGTTILLVTHNMMEAEILCDKVAFLSNGVIVEYDKPQTICERYRQLKTFKLILKDGTQTEINDDIRGREMLSQLINDNCVETINSNRVTLGDVFLIVTGKELV